MVLSRRMDRRSHLARRGAAAVELAILLPLLAVLFVITIDYARVFFFSLTMQNCARNGALYNCDSIGIADSPYTSVNQATLADASGFPTDPSVSTTSGNDSSGNGYVQVSTNYTFSTLAKYPGVAKTTALSRSVRMRVLPVVPNIP